MDKEIGKVIHYYGKAGVVVIKLSDKLALGDTIKIKKGESEFTEAVGSMQVDYKNVESVKAGDEVAVKISGPTKEGAIVYKVEQ